MNKKEYGGYLPLELNKGFEYYELDADHILRLNCGRSAILCAAMDAGYTKIHLPFYTCQSVSASLKEHDIPFCFYHIDPSFRPVNVRLKEGEALLWTNYFGIGRKQQEDEIVADYQNAILDHTQSFFAEPVMHVYNAYSCRKFFGVSDGAYLIHSGICGRDWNQECRQDISSPTALYLMSSIEMGTNAAYQDSLVNEERVAQPDILQMSKLTRQILCSIDYEAVKQTRKSNFFYLHAKLKELNELPVLAERTAADGRYQMEEEVPMVYPFLYECDGLREYLIRQHIYVPQWWKWVAESKEAAAFERKLSKYLFALPIDQRYDEADMEYISKIILDYVKKK